MALNCIRPLLLTVNRNIHSGFSVRSTHGYIYIWRTDRPFRTGVKAKISLHAINHIIIFNPT